MNSVRTVIFHAHASRPPNAVCGCTILALVKTPRIMIFAANGERHDASIEARRISAGALRRYSRVPAPHVGQQRRVRLQLEIQVR